VVLGLDLDRNTGPPGWGFSWFLSVAPGKCRDGASVRLRQLLPNPSNFIIHNPWDEIHGDTSQQTISIINFSCRYFVLILFDYTCSVVIHSLFLLIIRRNLIHNICDKMLIFQYIGIQTRYYTFCAAKKLTYIDMQNYIDIGYVLLFIIIILSGVRRVSWYCGHYWPIVPAPDDRWWWLWRNCTSINFRAASTICYPLCIALLDHLCLNQQRQAYIGAPAVLIQLI
jgi:hypothetical protein